MNYTKCLLFWLGVSNFIEMNHFHFIKLTLNLGPVRLQFSTCPTIVKSGQAEGSNLFKIA